MGTTVLKENSDSQAERRETSRSKERNNKKPEREARTRAVEE